VRRLRLPGVLTGWAFVFRQGGDSDQASHSKNDQYNGHEGHSSAEAGGGLVCRIKRGGIECSLTSRARRRAAGALGVKIKGAATRRAGEAE
jgi:hypothetical protein